ncbi:MAG: GNAT family N-acetyltransferase [Firmicutes bacterium]|nr:GNAT family N-acetyltransferase [Bacillota bacterium]
MEFRPYRPGDEEGIRALLSLVFKEKREINWWRWYYQEGPAGPALIWLALNRGQVVGHRALVPYRIWDGSGYKIACQATDAAVHPEHRGKGIFRRLTEEVLAEARERGWALVFSFPNEKSFPLNRRLGWVPRQKLRKWVKPLFAASFPGYNKKAPNLKTLHRVGKEFDRLWELYGTAKTAGICKDARYLQWRYLDSTRKSNYILLVWERRGQIMAYSVIGIGGRRGHLLEFMPGSMEPLPLLQGVEKHLGQRGVHFMTMWPLPEIPGPAWRRGYVPNLLQAGILALRPLTEEIPSSWRVTPGDTDYA